MKLLRTTVVAAVLGLCVSGTAFAGGRTHSGSTSGPSCALTVSGGGSLEALGSGLTGDVHYGMQLYADFASGGQGSVEGSGFTSNPDGSFTYLSPYPESWDLSVYPSQVVTAFTFVVYPIIGNIERLDRPVVGCSMSI